MKLELFDYNLPKEFIAQEPVEPRDASRLMVVKGKEIEHKTFSDILDYLEKDDILVLNDTKVEPVKLIGKKSTGARAEFLISKKLSKKRFMCQITSNKVKKGNEFIFEKGLTAKVKKESDGFEFEVEFNKDNVEEIIQDIGEMPTPPYIKKKAKKEQYQTVYAKHSGSIAAPTAGFHFTPALLKKIEKKGIKIVKITLHVSYGTFLPVKTEDIKQHKMHDEWFSISKQTADIINNRHKRLIIVGTTALRALESATDDLGILQPKTGTTDIFIYPGYSFKLKPDMMITNFHLPKSTLIMLVSALIGRENIMNAYKTAVEKKYRFYSFGDAMLLITT
ncbi:tRNA preQ1(34) S-adenosylmethionine ribosyltransferase-isomerase QueA [Candidatus Woesearchaeota archaeon]|nr:tRNA preQ1(34) S-adenosylmethionine ribosyltransferase-isomerase QueA [Candidatus Woesearchaeota archaeon]